MKLPINILLLAATMTLAVPAYAASGFSAAICSSEYTESDANTIVRTVFEDKYQRLLREKSTRLIASGTLSRPFIQKNDGLKFVICDNPGAFDSLAVYGTGVAFDIQMIGFLSGQARALIAGAILNPSDQMDLHRRLMLAFITQGAKLNINPIQQVRKDALATGVEASRYDALLADPGFKKREQNVFLVALYFLSMHERCHFGLDHGPKIQSILRLSVADQAVKRHELELDADKCAINIINADEDDFNASPISYFGLLMTVTTQVIVSAYAPSPESSSHPSGRARLAEAQAQVLQFVTAKQTPGTEKYEKYRGTIEGVGTYMVGILDYVDANRVPSSKVR